MSAGSRIDLSEFFNDDDSEGHRFLNFIKNKKGGARTQQKFLFMDYETDRLSFDVQLEKLPTPELKQVKKSSQIETTQNHLGKDSSGNFKVPNTRDIPRTSTSPSQHPDDANKRSMRSSRSIRRSGGVISSGDTLRRLSIKNCNSKNLKAGRRTLLQEFDSTVDYRTNFAPSTCSTPMSHATPSDPQLSSNTNPLPQIRSIETDIANKTIASDACYDSLLRTLRRKDDELKNYMESILDKTLKKIEGRSTEVQNASTGNTATNKTGNSTASKRTFTLERGSVPGQFVLTSDENNDQNNRISNLQQSPKQRSRTITNLATSQQSIHNCESALRKSAHQDSPGCSLSQGELYKDLQTSCSNKQVQKQADLQNTHSENCEIQNLSHNNQPTKFPTQNIEMHVTRTLPNITDNMTIEKRDSNINNVNEQNSSRVFAVQKQSFQPVEDIQNLSDILTEDEENTPKSTFKNAQCTREIPLNLVQNSRSLRRKRPGKIVLENKLDNSRLTIPEPEVEIPPPAHTRKQVDKKIYKPLNRPPGTPLNGEKYAQELARMSNYEILDLRKRNSMGEIFSLSDCKTRRMVEEINKKKHQLDDQIERELLKRNLRNATRQPSWESDKENAVEAERLPVPYSFRDSVTTQEKKNSTLMDFDFIDENPSDRVQFKTKRQSNRKGTPEILKQYLELSKRYGKRKQKKYWNNASKRSLYNTKAIYLSDEDDSSTAKSCSAERTSCAGLRKLSIPYLKSPRISSNNLITTPKVVSPPPAAEVTNVSTRNKRSWNAAFISTATGEVQNSPNKIHPDVVADSTETGEIDNTLNEIHVDGDENLALPPPPPGFESDSATITNNTTNRYCTNVTLEVRTINEGTTTDNLNNNDEHLFKKPTKPAPKKRGKKTGNALNVIQESTEDVQRSIDRSADLTEGGSLRRSKRGQVPRIPIPILGMLHDKITELDVKRRATLKKKQQQNARELKKSNKNKLLDFTASSGSSKSTATSIATVSANASAISDCGNQRTKMAKRAKSSRTDSKQQIGNAARSQKTQLPSVESVNAFDQLKQTSLASDATNTQNTSHSLIKSFEIRLRRAKTPEPTPTVDSARVSSTSTFNNTSSNIDLVSWLKNMGGDCNTDQQASESLKGMRISNGTSLCFTELQGVEYAFYDTVERASLGYLRFRPLQVKPKKKAKRFDLHFINLVGVFRITVNTTERVLNVGDMISIGKLSSYDIQNLSDEVSILMVIKK